MADPWRVAATLLFATAFLASALPPAPAAGAALPPSPAAPFSERPGVLLARVYPNAARDDEFVELENAGPVTVDLAGWSLTDLEATATFPPGVSLLPGARLVAARNATAYEEDVRRAADLTYGTGDGIRMAGGMLRLADGGDEVLLQDATGALVDAYVYGASSYLGAGWSGPPGTAPARGEIAVRIRTADGLQDHDDAGDWDGFRTYRLGQSAFDPEPVMVEREPVVILSPDDGRGRLLSFLASANHSLEVAVYTLTSEGIGSVLADRARSGVRVRVLLEGAPVGGIEDRERTLAAQLVAAGAQVRFLQGASDAVKRYRYLHAKYAIVDGAAALVASENFGDSGFPAPGDGGNRGWSVIVESLELARQLWEVFEEDFDPSRADSVAAEAQPALAGLEPVATATWAPQPPGEGWQGRLILGPDTALDADGVLGAFAAARERIWIEAFYADDLWDNRPNPFLEAAFAVAARGVSVRILLDGSSWSSEEGSAGNQALAASLNERARREAADLEARVLTPHGLVERLHNKGAVVDGRTALVSSMNWAFGSATENREVGLLLDDAGVARRLESAFLRDWEGDLPDPGEEPVIDDPAVVLVLYAFVAAASALSLRKMRRRDKGLKPRFGMVRRGVLRTALRRGHREVRVLPPELVAEPGDGPRGRPRDRGGREAALPGVRGPPGDRGP